MWVFGTMGILMPSKRPDRVTPKGDPHTLQVRARVKEHIERFRRDYCNAKTEDVQHGGVGPIHYTPNMDYQYRAYVSPEDFSRGLALMVADIDWTKFKPQTEIQYRDKKLHSFYTSTWSRMLSEWPVGSSFSHGADRREARSSVGGSARGGRNYKAPTPRYGVQSWGPLYSAPGTHRPTSGAGFAPGDQGTFTFHNDESVTRVFAGVETTFAAGSREARRQRWLKGLDNEHPSFGALPAAPAPRSHADRLAEEEIDESALDFEEGEWEEFVDDEPEPSLADIDETLLDELVGDSIQPGSLLTEFREEVTSLVARLLAERATRASADVIDSAAPQLPSGAPGVDQPEPHEALTSIAQV